MPILLDVRTVSLACGATYLSMAAAMTYVWRHRRTYPGFGAWTLSAWLGGLGILLVVGRGILPDAITILLANMLIFTAVMLIVTGLESFTGGVPKRKVYAALLAFASGLLAIHVYVHPSLCIRLAVISFTIGGFCFRAAHLARRHLPRVLMGANPLIFTTISIVGVLYVLRGIISVVAPPPSQDFMAPSLLQGAWLLVFLIAQTTVNAGLIVLNGQRVERDLQLAIEECKVLRGIIPICASCKKIRDDQGAWNQVEAYIRRHTEAEFTHGICPDCARDLYPKGAPTA